MKKISRLAATVLAAAVALTSCASTKTEAAKPAEISGKTTSIILVSFGTSFEESRKATCVAVEDDVKAAFPDFYVTSAYTSSLIRNKLRKNGIEIFSVDEALKDAQSKGFRNVIVQPTHMMYGLEYNEMQELAEPYKSRMHIVFGKPLLATKDEISAVLATLAKNVAGTKRALVLMGHGTDYFSNFLYAAADYQAKAEGHPEIFVGTVEAYPDCATVIELAKKAGYRSVLLEPLMLVAGDHANNDMAGDEDDSWKSQFTAAGFEVETLIKGLGEYPEVRAIYIDHIKEAMASPENAE